MRAGASDNVIPDQALLRLNVRTFKDQVRERVLSAIKRILEAEASASGAPKPPETSVLGQLPLTRNDEAATRKVAAAFERRFGAEDVQEIASPISASEDFGLFAAAWGVPAVFWAVGGVDPETVQEGRESGQVGRAAGQPLPGLRARDRPHPARRHRGDAHGRRRVADE